MSYKQSLDVECRRDYQEIAINTFVMLNTEHSLLNPHIQYPLNGQYQGGWNTNQK